MRKLNSRIMITVVFTLFSSISYAQVIDQTDAGLLFRSFEMISNGNGLITDVAGFDVTVPPTGHGAYSAEWYRDVLQGDASVIFDLAPNWLQAAGLRPFELSPQRGILTMESRLAQKFTAGSGSLDPRGERENQAKDASDEASAKPWNGEKYLFVFSY